MDASAGAFAGTMDASAGAFVEVLLGRPSLVHGERPSPDAHDERVAIPMEIAQEPKSQSLAFVFVLSFLFPCRGVPPTRMRVLKLP